MDNNIIINNNYNNYQVVIIVDYDDGRLFPLTEVSSNFHKYSFLCHSIIHHSMILLTGNSKLFVACCQQKDPWLSIGPVEVLRS